MSSVFDSSTVEGQLTCKSFGTGLASIATSAVTTVLTASSEMVQVLTGATTGQIVQLPNATTILAGQTYELYNPSSVLVQINDGGGNLVMYLAADKIAECVLQTAGTAAGVWQVESRDIVASTNQSAVMTLNDDFLSSLTSGAVGNLGWVVTLVGGGSSIASPGPLVVGHPGVITLNSGAVNQLASIALGQLLIGGGPFTWEAMIRVNTLGLAAQQYTFQCGLGAATGLAADPTSGIFFEYANGTGGNFWRARVGTSSTYTSVTSGTLSVAATSWYKLQFTINPAASSVTFSVSAAGGGAVTALTTITTNIPTAIGLAPFFQIRKTNGNTVMPVDVDYCYISYPLNTQR